MKPVLYLSLMLAMASQRGTLAADPQLGPSPAPSLLALSEMLGPAWRLSSSSLLSESQNAIETAARLALEQTESERFKRCHEMGWHRLRLLESFERELTRALPTVKELAALTSLLPQAQFDRHGKPELGSANALVVVDLVTDFTCGRACFEEPELRKLMERFRDRVRFVAHHFPLGPYGSLAFEWTHAARCAHAQGRYWDYRAALFSVPKLELAEETSAFPLALAETLGLDLSKFRDCFTSERTRLETLLEQERLAQVGAVATPLAFVNGRIAHGGRTVSGSLKIVLERLLDLGDGSAREASFQPALASPP